VKRRTEDYADSMSGVTHVQNNLRVNLTTGNDNSPNTSTPSSIEYGARTKKGNYEPQLIPIKLV
jgi:hypothetical protein